jgi:hypothetical protein
MPSNTVGRDVEISTDVQLPLSRVSAKEAKGLSLQQLCETAPTAKQDPTAPHDTEMGGGDDGTVHPGGTGKGMNSVLGPASCASMYPKFTSLDKT